MDGIWTMGEMLVEIMRPRTGMPLDQAGEFLGPFPSGAPAIFIDTVARLGLSAAIIGGVANDGFGACLLDRLQSDGVNTDWVHRASQGSTAVAFVAYDDDGSRSFIYHIDGTPAVIVPDLSRISTSGTGFFHVMGCSLMANDNLRQKIIDTANRFSSSGARVSFDPNIREELLGGRSIVEIIEPILRQTTLLLPGESELRLISGTNDLQDAIRTLFDRYPLEIIVLKHGKLGSTVYTPTSSLEIAPYVVEEVDPTGAGDCFDAGFLVGLLNGNTLEQCGRIAAAAGAINAAAFGPMEGKLSPQSIAELVDKYN